MVNWFNRFQLFINMKTSPGFPLGSTQTIQTSKKRPRACTSSGILSQNQVSTRLFLTLQIKMGRMTDIKIPFHLANTRQRLWTRWPPSPQSLPAITLSLVLPYVPALLPIKIARCSRNCLNRGSVSLCNVSLQRISPVSTRPRSFLTVELHPTDRESRKELKRCTSSLPTEQLLFLMPKDEDGEEASEEKEEDQRIPEPRTAVTGGGAGCQTTVWHFLGDLTSFQKIRHYSKHCLVRLHSSPWSFLPCWSCETHVPFLLW